VLPSPALRHLSKLAVRHVDFGATRLLAAATRRAAAATRRAAAAARVGAHVAARVAAALSRGLAHFLGPPLDALRRAAAAAARAARRALRQLGHWLGQLATTGARLLGAAARLLVAPLRVVWRSPTLSLGASVAAVAALYALHASGAWARVLATGLGALHAARTAATGAAAVAATATASTSAIVVASAATSFTTASELVSGAGARVARAVARRHAFALGRGVHLLRGVVEQTGAAQAVLASAGASAGALHAAPAFGTLVWGLVALVSSTSPGDVPPKALAAVQLALVSHFWV
jgi:hypothetical protein